MSQQPEPKADLQLSEPDVDETIANGIRRARRLTSDTKQLLELKATKRRKPPPTFMLS